ncbi:MULTISPECIES: hypothetical protein [unclassified Streptomyces]|uniref:hypothetical protein n=1 Tax=unclassified Streptomyces TaxID=2593676 RepID=UPI000DAD6AF9|nr:MULTISPECIES: hypothetical protein [unclassified Streptomyces]PZT75828.1 hypothetical protein DNK56_20665 [Streptomyces sp. AC1-42W]PZT80219.1 hypothetical protein DNK55_12020 [Streptomyces sp. AC1-42T]
MDVLIVDTTRANNGTAAAITDSVVARHPGLAKLALVTRADQAEEFSSLPIGTENRTLVGLPGDLEAAQAVADLIKNYSAEFDDAAFTVYSFHYRVLGKQGDLALLDKPINTYSLRDHVPGRVGPQGSSWPVALMPLEDALKALRTALQRAQAPSGARRPVYKTELRTLLTMEEPRFDKNRYPLAGTHRLISLLLQEALSRGMIAQFGTEPTISVALQEPAGPSRGMVPSPASTRSVTAVASTAATANPATTPTTAAAGIPAQAHASAVPTASVNDTRSWHFANVLRQLRLGPYPEVRHDLYDRIIAITQENQDSSAELTVRTLARRAVAQVRSNAPEHFPRRNGDDLPRDRYDWRGLENFMVHVLSRTEIALGANGKPLPRETSIWETRQAPVQQPLPADIKFAFDAEMVFEVVRVCGNVTPDDIVHLAGAMLGGRGAQQTDHMENVLDYLLKQGRVTGHPGTEWLVPTGE